MTILKLREERGKGGKGMEVTKLCGESSAIVGMGV
jgi:hypothetical protein